MLNAALAVERLRRNQRGNRFLRRSRPVVAVSNCRQDLFAVGIQQNVIDTPGVDRDRLRDLADFFAFRDAGFHFTKQMINVPDQMAAVRLHAVIKTVDLFQNDLLALKMRQNMAAG